MSIAVQTPPMAQQDFFDWAEAQNARYEFDGFQPVAMTGGSANHSQVVINILLALRTRLPGTGCRVLGPDAGVATVGDTVRYPDALVTCTAFAGRDRLVPGAVAVFEVISPNNPGVDRIVKVREYLAVPSIRTYVIVEQQSIGLTVLERRDDGGWTASVLTEDEVLLLPHPAIEIPVAELYEGTDIGAV